SVVDGSAVTCRSCHLYQMPTSIDGCLTAYRYAVCEIAKNHSRDYCYAGLVETMETLTHAGLKVVGAGRDQEEAFRPARIPLGDGRGLVVFAIGSETAGIPACWATSATRPGVALLQDLSEATAVALLDRG